MGKMTIDASSTEFVVNQATFYLTFLVSLGAAAAIIVQTVRGINTRIRKAKEEADAKAEAEHAATRRYVDDKMAEINQMKERIEYIYRKIIDDFFSEDAANKRRQRGEQRK